MLIIGGHSAHEGGCVFSFERVLGSCHSSWCRNVFSKRRASARFTEYPNSKIEVKGNACSHCRRWCLSAMKRLAAVPSKARASGRSKITQQLPDIINGQKLLGGDQMLLNGKHLVDIFLWLPQRCRATMHGGPHTAQGNAIMLTARPQLHFPALLCMYSLSAALAGTAARSSPNLLFCLWSDSVAYSDT